MKYEIMKQGPKGTKEYTVKSKLSPHPWTTLLSLFLVYYSRDIFQFILKFLNQDFAYLHLVDKLLYNIAA